MVLFDEVDNFIASLFEQIFNMILELLSKIFGDFFNDDDNGEED